MSPRWRKLARLPAVWAVASLLAACAYVPVGGEAEHPAVRVADRWAARNVPGFALQRPDLRAVVLPQGPYWLVVYEARPGVVTAAPQVLVSKFGGRIVRVDYGQ